jgi:hypothetical protein
MRKLPVIPAFTHAVQSTWHNLGFAFHASWMWLVVLVPLNTWAESKLLGIKPPDASGRVPPEQLQAMLLVYLFLFASMVIYSSIAVSWHRYILKDEVPQGTQQLRLDGTVWRYVGNTLLVGLLIGLLTLPPTFLFGMVVAMMGGLHSLVMAAYLTVLALMIVPAFYRLSLKLPAIAVQRQGFRLGDGWHASRGNMLQLLMLGGLTIATVLCVGILLGAVDSFLAALWGDWVTWLFLVIRQLISWVLAIFTITVLTSLYGFFVEQRDF